MSDNRLAEVYHQFIAQLAKNMRCNLLVVERYQPGNYHGNRMIYHLHRDSKEPEAFVLEEHEVLGLASIANRRFDLHIPIFDFDVPAVEIDLFPVAHLGPIWIIESSPNHTHICCETLVSWEEYERLLDELPVDPRYRIWSKRRRYGTVRITTGGNKPHLPVLITKVFVDGPPPKLLPYEP